MNQELIFQRAGKLAWAPRPEPRLQAPTDAIVRPFVAARCDGDTLPIHRPVSRLMQAGLKTGLLDASIGHICGPVPFRGPFAIGHECVAEVVAVGSAAADSLRVGQVVVVPWAVSCGDCDTCRRGLTSKCPTTSETTLSAYGFGAASGPWGAMIADRFRVPHAAHMLVPLPETVPPLRAAAASDNLSDGWRAVAPPLADRPGAGVAVLGGGAKSIGLYAAGIAAHLDAGTVHYIDDDERRRAIAARLGAAPLTPQQWAAMARCGYDIVVEATSTARGLRRAIRATAAGGVCTAVGYYVGAATAVPVMHMYATDITLRVGVSHARAALPDVLGFLAATQFPAEQVTTMTAPWHEAPRAYTARTTKLVLHRTPIHHG